MCVFSKYIFYTNVIVIMRPDEHKKKRSAQYKKKHGMNKDDQSKDARRLQSAGKGKVKVDQRQDGKADGRGASAAKLPHSSSGSDSSDNDGDSAAPVRQSFKRREVVSNWARYEILPPETETTQKRGEDFANLLNSAGGTSSQFRFKEEEDWEDDESVCADTKLLTVDPTDLAASLQCIPLYQRLGVDQDLFSTEQIQEMEADAREHTLQYNPSPKPADITQPHRTNPPSVDNPSTTDHTQLSVNKVKRDKDTNGINLTAVSKENLTKPKVDGDLFKQKSDSQKSADVVAGSVGAGASVNTTSVVRTPVINNHNSTGEKTTGVSRDNLDDDLDFLLSLENPSEATSLGETTHQNSIQETAKSPPDKTGNTTQSKESAKETENLEDWLDSVLD
ncbi:cell death regulator Aven-like [Argopecten irradians]|uniref:cell death regulator Aven-like n=1 Tax=Argopecten irradians TaxID=31199 RepID=UPI00371A4E1A